MRSRRSRERCGCCKESCRFCKAKSRALRARLFVAIMQGAWVAAQVWQLVAR